MTYHGRAAVVACLAALLGALAAQEASKIPVSPAGSAQTQTPEKKAAPEQSVTEMSSHDEQTTFKTRVNLVMVPVVVRDAKGKVVTGLTKADFQLSDRGKPQTISRFSAEKAGAQAIKFAEDADGAASKAAKKAAEDAVPERFVAYLFDDIHVSPGDLAMARQAALRHIANELGLTDRAALFTTSGIGAVDFTDDRAKLLDAINRLMPRPIARSTMQECPNISYYMADMIVNKNDPGALAAATQDTIACMNLSGAAASTAAAQAQGAAQRMLGIGEQESHVSYEVLKDVLRRMSATPGQRIVVLASPGFLTTDFMRQEETDVIDRAIRNNITINAVDIRGLYVDPSLDVSRRGSSINAQRLIDQYTRFSAQAEGDTLAEIAYGTGGTFFQNNNSMDEGFRRTATAPESYYILGFSPQNLKLDGSYHSLKVTLTAKAHFDLQARKGYYSPKRLADSAETAKEEITEALFSREELRELPVELHTQYFKGTNGMANVTVLAHLDVKRFKYRKADERNNNTVTIVSSIFDHNGNIVSAITKTLDMKLKDDTLQKKLDNGLTVRTMLSVKPGAYLVRLVVRDSEGQQISAENSAVDIQ